MGDIASDPAAVPAANTAPAEKPDVDTLFAPKDVDELFPADFKRTNQPVRNVSPVQDMLFANPGRAHARILDAFGYGFAQNWGAATKEFSEADEYLKKAGVFSDYQEGQRSIIKAANDVIMRPAVAAFFTGKGVLGGAVHGVQAAITQAGEEYGAPNLAKDIAGGIEAFPTGIHQPMGITHEVPHVITEAKSLDTIGQGEAGYFGTRPVEPTTPAEAAHSAKIEDVAAPHTAPGEAAEAPPSPAVEAAPAAVAPTPDIHAVARQVAPDTFREFDALAQKKETFRRWIDELREVRDQEAAANAPHAAEIADLQAKLEDATPRNAKKYQARLAPLVEERDAYLADHTQGDSADMAKVRKQLMETDYRMRDLAPDVSKAYRDAEGRMPQVEKTEAVPDVREAAPIAETSPVAQQSQAAEAAAQEMAPAAEVREVRREPQSAGGAEQPKAAEPVAEAVAAGPVGFKTAKGSTYVVHEDGTTTRDKAARSDAGHEGDSGLKPRTAKTIYVDSSVASALSGAGLQGMGPKGFRVVIKDGKATGLTWNDKAGKWGASPSARDIAFTTTPEVGKSPVELWKPADDVPGHEAYRGQHAGNAITEITKAEPAKAVEAKTAPAPESPLIAHAPSIVADVTQKLKAVGRPAEEADAAAQIVAAYWETRAQRFEGKKGTAAEMYARETPEIKTGDTRKKQASREMEMAQTVTRQGRIRIRDEGRNTITLLKDADASTFIHETGHDWLDRMIRDSKDAEAPAALKADSDTVLKWLGVDSVDAIKTKQHEKFARGFETYMMEGRAPSQALAKVFAKFRDWLTTIYRTVKALKSPISEDIRGVFDRMLAEKPEKTVIAVERETKGGSLAERHEAHVETTPPERAHEVANTIEAERDSHVDRNLLENQGNDTRLKDTGTEAEGRAARGAQPSGHADASGPVGGEAEAPVGAGAERGGGSQAPAESAQPRKESERVNKAPTPLLNFLASQGGLKATDALISDLRQALGGKNRYVPGFGQLIRTPKQLSSAAAKAGRLEAMSVDRAREAAIEAGHLPKDATVADFIDAIENEVREQAARGTRPHDEAEVAHAEHNFLEGLNDRLKEAGGHELSDAERTRALELHRQEGLNDPSDILERLALEADDAEIAGGAPDRLEGIPGWDVAAPGWDIDERGAASSEGHASAAGESVQPGSGAARSGGEAEKPHPLDANAALPRPETRLIDKAGNIRLDNLGTPEDVNFVIRQTADELAPYNEAITRGVIPDAEVVKLADALGMDASKLSERKLGQAFNAEQIVAARKLLIQSANDVHDAMAKAAEGDEAAILAYAQAKSRHLMIQEQVSGITAEAGRALRAFRALEGQQEAAAIGAFLQDTTGKTLYQLQREAQLGLELETPQQVSKFVADSAKPTYKDMAIEAWMAALLSGPRTHVANILGNSLASILHVIETAASCVVGAVLRSEDRVHPHEAIAEMFGMVQGSREGLVAAKKAFLTEEPQLTAALQAEKPHVKALPGVAGQIARTPLRLLGAEDEFFKAIAFRGDIYRQAYVIAAKEGLAPELMRQRVAELSMAPTDAMIEAAKKVADYQTFQNSLGKTGRAIQALSNSHALVKVVIPFVRTPLNLLKYANERSPLGVFSQEVRDNLAGKNGTRARDTQIARVTLGTMVGVTAFSLAAQGLITGGGPADKGKKSILQADGWQPYSVKVGDMYYSYNRLDPFSITMGVAADAYEIMTAAGADHPDKEHLPALVLGAISKNVLNRASLSGLSDLLQAVSDPERYGKNYIKGLVGSVVPAIAGQSAQTIDPTVREARNVIDTLKSRVPFVSQTLFPRRDVWGEPVVRGGALGPDLGSPIAESRLKNDPVNRALLDAGFFPSTVERKIRGIDLTDQQFDDYARLAGRMAKMQLNAFVNTPGLSTLPKQVRADKMREIVNHARESARSMILMQNKEIIMKANDAKKAKFTEGATAH